MPYGLFVPEVEWRSLGGLRPLGERH